jgi:hypothetical protein
LASGRQENVFQHFSTYPHAFLNPSTSKVVEMTLPFMWHNNFLSLNGVTGTSKETLGTIQIYDMNPLRIANVNASDSVTYNVFAWAENMKMSVPTEFTPTSNFSKRDEYNDGPVSTVATNVAQAAGMLSKAPIIGKFAKATEIGAGSIANIARIFGFSTPIMVQNPGRCELKMHGRLANTSGEDSAYSLALDPKQEITVDPRTVGVSPHDEMTIKSIATREQFLARCEWGEAVGSFTTPGAESLIFASLVNPKQTHITGSDGGKKRIQHTPAGYLSNMFQYWKGSCTYRVEVVCTPMHSGRLKLQFDPFIKSTAKVVSDVNTEDVNARYTMIMDLSEATSTEFTINWNNKAAWLKTIDDDLVSTFQPHRHEQTSFNLQALYDEQEHMGIFTVSVVNELVAPLSTALPPSSTTSPVQVNVYFKMCDDFMLAQPAELSSSWSTAKFSATSNFSDSTFVATSNTTTVDEHAIMEKECDPANTMVFFGESVVSIRSLIKRYCNVFTGDYNNDPRTANYELVTRYLPHTPAYVARTLARRNSFLSYLMPCYIVARGSTRYKLTYYDKGETTGPASAGTAYNWVERLGSRVNIDTIGYPVSNTVSLGSAAMDALLPHGYNGACFTESGYQPTLEFQMPFYSNTRYMLGTHFKNVDTSAGETALKNPAMSQILLAKNVYSGKDAHANIMQQWHAAGDDFSLSFFCGVPGIYT